MEKQGDRKEGEGRKGQRALSGGQNEHLGFIHSTMETGRTKGQNKHGL